MSALFNLNGLLLLIILFICTASYLKNFWPSLLLRNKSKGFKEMLRKGSVIGIRFSPIVSIICIILGFYNIIIR